MSDVLSIENPPTGETTGSSGPRYRPGRWSLVIVLLASAFQLWAVLHSRPLQSANDRSRWCTVWSLVERGTYHIDEIDQQPRWSTIDKVRHRDSESDPWHFYSSKPPLFPTIVAGLYALEKYTLGYNLTDHTAQVTQMLLVVINWLPMLLALLALRQSLAILRVKRLTEITLMISAGFGSMLNPFLTTLNNHTPAAVCVVFCIAAMIRLRVSARPAARDFVIVGISAALSCCFELPASLFGVITFFYVLRIDWKQTAKFYVPAALVPLAAFFVTNWICTGGIKPFYSYYGTEKYVFVHEGVPSYWSNPQGIDANSESTPVYAFHCLLGHHGILSLTPVFLLTLAGWWLGTRRSTGPRGAARSIYWIGIGLSCAVLLFYLTRFKNYNYGGNSAALRWMLWLTPFWWYGMIPAVERLATSWKGGLVVVLLLIPSIYAPLYSIHEPWRPAWVFQQMENAGWIDYRTTIPPFDPPRMAVIRQQPQTAGVVTTWLGSKDAAGTTIRLTTLDPVSLAGTQVCPVTLEIHRDSDAGATKVKLIAIPKSLAAGEDVGGWLKEISPDVNVAAGLVLESGDVTPASAAVQQVFRGLPSPRPYNSASPRYLKYVRPDGEKTAIRCERGASRVRTVDDRSWQRCDVMYADELSFGVAQWKITVTDSKSGKLTAVSVYTCQDLP